MYFLFLHKLPSKKTLKLTPKLRYLFITLFITFENINNLIK